MQYNEPWIISTLDLVTGEGRTLTDPADVSSVSGVVARLAVDRRISSYGLMVMGRYGSGKHRVARGGGDPDDGSPKSSPDGRRIAYLDENPACGW